MSLGDLIYQVYLQADKILDCQRYLITFGRPQQLQAWTIDARTLTSVPRGLSEHTTDISDIIYGALRDASSTGLKSNFI